ncbi:hypothetical protein MWN33_17855 [Starkeya koreensis]|uniref:Uncharacterized protein n=1 Tax=Ancylobacter koreensis TaxID=266121 RepID=A0ABT0DRU9_9HYPH|nr:hypothetical protein [Ancylobacter koreensis]MCK0209899.1 hypothetical protein [Ancylobacter koreensis]
MTLAMPSIPLAAERIDPAASFSGTRESGPGREGGTQGVPELPEAKCVPIL